MDLLATSPIQYYFNYDILKNKYFFFDFPITERIMKQILVALALVLENVDRTASVKNCRTIKLKRSFGGKKFLTYENV